jgi:hypothetical protein
MGFGSSGGESCILLKLAVCQSSGFSPNIQRFFSYLHETLQLHDLVVGGFYLYAYVIFDFLEIYLRLQEQRLCVFNFRTPTPTIEKLIS